MRVAIAAGQRSFRIVAVTLAAAGLAVAVWHWQASSHSAPPKQKGVPVQVVRATRNNTPAYLTNIATVQPFNTVLVRARVDGQITKVDFTEGSEVKKGDVLVELDPRPFEAQWRAALAQKDRDTAQLENARRDERRYKSLIDADAGALQTLDTTRAQVAQLSAAVALDQAQIDFAHLQLTYATITAPFDGRTGARLVDVGNMVHATDATGLVLLTQIHPIAVTFSLPQSTLATVREQQRHHALRVLALDPDRQQALGEGELSLIDNQIDVTTGTFHCKAIFANPDESLWPGQFVTARVMLEALPNAVVIPAAAVQEGPRGPYVYVVTPDRTAELRPVRIGQRLAEQAVVSEGLRGDEDVIVEGQFRVEPGAAVDLTAAPVANATPAS
ncbi:MAG TPA: efflux RND transporter periplasmic adaptor subunit [Steroidobacteraceae bacterium]|nr:efflux RND transporter periplasmic adaptor subunit [Steroidobacteraceae bacterium]